MFPSPTPINKPKATCDNMQNPVLTPPPSSSGENSPFLEPIEDIPDTGAQSTQKKKRKKKPKKSAKAKEQAPTAKSADTSDIDARPPVLCISRNKHWRYISSYHGPWLQLPLELLESLLVLNLDPATLSAPETRLPHVGHIHQSNGHSNSKQRDRGFQSLPDFSPPDSPRNTFSSLPPPPPLPAPKAGKATPPPIDPGVFRCVSSIRKLIDEAAELSVRASSGLSAAALGSMRGSPSGINNNSPWAAAQSLGLNPLGDNGGGRNVAMSAMRVHRLRALAVQKLAQAYKADEIASSVMVMQGGSVFDDVAERVLKYDPNDIDAKYVHFFHEKIPSRQLAESTTTQVLDELISAQPQRLEFYRTRGIVHCFRDEYWQATKDFTYALKEARAARKAKVAHRNTSQTESRGRGGKKKKGKSNGQDNPSGPGGAVGDTTEGPDGDLILHPSVLPDAPEPIEPQLLFLRGAAFLQHAIFLIEEAVFKIEEIRRVASVDGAELRLCYIENGKYGGVEIGHPDGPLGKKDGPKQLAYRQVLSEDGFREQITTLVKKAIRDHEKFLSHFDTLEGPSPAFEGDLAHRTEYAFNLSESARPGNQQSHMVHDAPTMFTTYHPLLVESYFSVLICLLVLADFQTILPTFSRTAALVDGLEGYPVFLPPRSMAQAEFIEILERLAMGWKVGVQPHSLTRSRNCYPTGNGKLAIEAPPASPVLSCTSNQESMSMSSLSLSDLDPNAPSGSSSSAAATPPLNFASGSNIILPPSGLASGRDTPSSSGTSSQARGDLVDSLDCARILLAPVVARQRERAEKVLAEKISANSAGGNGKKGKKPLNINIPLHGPRVEVVLAWLGAVHLPELEGVA